MLGHPSAAYEALIQRLNDPSLRGNMGMELGGRLGYLQSILRNQTNIGNRRSASRNSNRPNAQFSAREIVHKLIASIGEKLSEYGPYFFLPMNLNHLQV
jgi:hypothetical protein